MTQEGRIQWFASKKHTVYVRINQRADERPVYELVQLQRYHGRNLSMAFHEGILCVAPISTDTGITDVDRIVARRLGYLGSLPAHAPV